MAKPLLAGNWKMHGTAKTAAKLAADLANSSGDYPELIVFPPYVCIPAVVTELLAVRNIAIGAQNISHHSEGAYTGEISGKMLSDIGCSHVLVGHSERRTNCSESNELVAEKFAAAKRSGLIPILCVGETLEQRESKQYFRAIEEQIVQGLFHLDRKEFSQVVVAYEPVWAIGTGLNASPEQAQEIHAYIRKLIGNQFNEELAASTSILYGGSVKPENAAALFLQADIDGGLIGGASLKARDFIDIVKAMR